MTTQPRKKLARCVGGSYIERMNEAIEFSEKSRVRVTELSKEIGDIARAELINRYRNKKVPPPSPSMLATAADEAISKDARWKVAVADEQWGGRLATMYSLAELTLSTREGVRVLKGIYAQLDQSNAIMRRQLAAQEETNALLRQLVMGGGKVTPAQREGD